MTAPVIPITNVVFDLAVEVAACLCGTLSDWGLPDPCMCGVVPGVQVARDYFGDCDDAGCGNGMAWVRVASIYPSTATGVWSQQAGNCATSLGVDLEVGVLRCISAGEDDGGPVPPSELLAASLLQSQDALAMRYALQCCVALPSKDFILGLYQPIGPEGGLVGGMWTVSGVL